MIIRSGTKNMIIRSGTKNVAVGGGIKNKKKYRWNYMISQHDNFKISYYDIITINKLMIFVSELNFIFLK